MDCEYINEVEEVTISQHASICSRAAHYLQYDRHLLFMYVVICTLKWAVNHFIAARQRYINWQTINNRKGKKFVNATWQDKAIWIINYISLLQRWANGYAIESKEVCCVTPISWATYRKCNVRICLFTMHSFG